MSIKRSSYPLRLAIALEAALLQEESTPGALAVVPSVLIEPLFDEDSLTIEELEDVTGRTRVAAVLKKALITIPGALPEAAMLLLFQSLFSRINIKWETGQERKLAMRVREAVIAWRRVFGNVLSSCPSEIVSTTIDYAESVDTWLEEFLRAVDDSLEATEAVAAPVTREDSRLRDFKTVRRRRFPPNAVVKLAEDFPKLYEHRFVQSGLDHLWSLYRDIAEYSALRSGASSSFEPPRVRALFAFALAETCFASDFARQWNRLPGWRPEEFPPDVRLRFENDAEVAGETWTSMRREWMTSRSAVAYGAAVGSKNPLLAASINDLLPNADPSYTGALWRTDLTSLLSVPTQRVALNVPAVLALFTWNETYDGPLSEAQQQACLQYAADAADALVRFADDSEGGTSPEKALESLVIRGYTRVNCRIYLEAAESPRVVTLRGSPVGEMLGAITYSALVGEGAHRLTEYSNLTAAYVQAYSKITYDLAKRYEPLLARMHMDENALLLPLRAFAPAQSTDTLETLGRAKASVVEQLARWGTGAKRLSELLLKNFEARLITVWDTPNVKTALHGRGFSPSSDEPSPASIRAETDILEAVAAARAGKIPPELNPTIITRETFAEKFITEAASDLLAKALDTPFTLDGLLGLEHDALRLRDYGMAYGMPEIRDHRLVAHELKGALAQFTKDRHEIDSKDVARLDDALHRLDKLVRGGTDSLNSSFEASIEMSSEMEGYSDETRKIKTARWRPGSRLMTGAVRDTAERTRELLETELTTLSKSVAITARRIFSIVAVMRDLLIRETDVDRDGRVAIADSKGKTLGVWSDMAIIRAYAHAAAKIEAGIVDLRNDERDLKNLKQKIVSAVGDLGKANDEGSGPRADETAWVPDIEEARLRAVDYTMTLRQATTTNVLARMTRVLGEWSALIKAESKAIDGTIDDVHTLLRRAEMTSLGSLTTPNGQTSRVVKPRPASSAAIAQADKRDVELISLLEHAAAEERAWSKEKVSTLGTISENPNATSGVVHGASGIITSRKDVTDWNDVDRQLLLRACVPTESEIDPARLSSEIPDTLVTLDDVLTTIDRAFSEDVTRVNNMDES